MGFFKDLLCFTGDIIFVLLSFVFTEALLWKSCPDACNFADLSFWVIGLLIIIVLLNIANIVGACSYLAISMDRNNYEFSRHWDADDLFCWGCWAFFIGITLFVIPVCIIVGFLASSSSLNRAGATAILFFLHVGAACSAQFVFGPCFGIDIKKKSLI